MNEDTTTKFQSSVKPIDPTLAQSETSDAKPVSQEIKTKRCQDCRALLPIASYGPHKRSKDGYSDTCKLCRSEYNSFDWTKKYGRKYKKHEPEIVRRVVYHNSTILTDCLTHPKIEIKAFSYVTKHDFKVYFGPSSNGIRSMSLFNVDGSIYREFSYSGDTVDIEKIKETLLGILKSLDLRLEYTDSDVIASKTVIYYF